MSCSPECLEFMEMCYNEQEHKEKFAENLLHIENIGITLRDLEDFREEPLILSSGETGVMAAKKIYLTLLWAEDHPEVEYIRF